MKFEEEFPRLSVAEDERRTILLREMDMYIPPIGVAKELIMEHCLNKQRVKEAFRKFKEHYAHISMTEPVNREGCGWAFEALEDLEQELGL